MGAAASLALAAVAAAGHYNVLRPESYQSALVRQMMQYDAYDPGPSFREGICFQGKGPAHFKSLCVEKASRYLIWGDSHAAGLYHGLAKIERKSGRPVSQITAPACPPDLGYGGLTRGNCIATNAFAFRAAKTLGNTVILGGDWPQYAEGRKEYFYKSFAATIQKLKASSIRVIVVLSVPQWTPTAPATWLRLRSNAFTRNDVVYVPNARYAEIEGVDNRLKTILRAEHAPYVTLMDKLCEQHNETAYCAVGVPYEKAIIPFQFDYGHLTVAGSDYVGKLIRDEIVLGH